MTVAGDDLHPSLDGGLDVAASRPVDSHRFDGAGR
jgi:hypothetical protein